MKVAIMPLYSLWLAAVLIGSLSVVQANAAATGGFLVHGNENQGNGDSRRTLTFYDADEINLGPIFSVLLPMENFAASMDLSLNNYEEIGSITVDPVTGDVYVASFDSTTGTGMVGGVAFPGTQYEDTEGDMDLYRINFQDVYAHWETNFKGQTAAGKPGVGGTTPKGFNNQNNLDYVTYGVGERTPAGEFNGQQTGVNAHANTFVLANAVNKIGEFSRNDPGAGFFESSLSFADDSTLMYIDDPITNAPADPTQDRIIRTVKKLSSSPGAATATVVSGVYTGGYNRSTTESWASTMQALVNLDSAPHAADSVGTPTVRSEPESSAFVSRNGVRGIWVSESDANSTDYRLGGGPHDLAFYQIDANGNGLGYRDIAYTGSLGTTFKSFVFDDNPAASNTTNDGKIDNIFIDSDTGDLIVIESGVGDTVQLEPSVIRYDVVSYDNGGKIELGAPSAKVTLAPQKDTNAATVFPLPEQGIWSAYDSAADMVYFISPGNGTGNSATESPVFEADIYVLDLATGLTTSYMNVDESLQMFTGAASTGYMTHQIHEDLVDFFTIAEAVEDDADFDGDGDIDGADFLTWQRNVGTAGGQSAGNANGDATIDGADLEIWRAQFGTSVVAAGAVPEPATAGLLIVCGVALALSRRRN